MLIRTVMLVDDEPDIRAIGEIALTAVGGFHAVVLGSGREALARAAFDRPDVILLDVMMPELDGVATLRALQTEEATRRVPVIFMTAKVQPGEVERYVELGAVGVIAKPFDPLALPDEIRRLLGADR